MNQLICLMSLKTLSEIFEPEKARFQGKKVKAGASKEKPADYEKLRITMEKDKEKRLKAIQKEKTTKKIKKNVKDRIKKLMNM